MTTLRDTHKDDLIRRLKRVEGQVRGIQRMITEDVGCESVAQQMAAARKALDRVFFSMMACAIEQEGTGAKNAGQALERIRHLSEVMAKFA
jgi:DNA-binding FrmR family transcriptional regulator